MMWVGRALLLLLLGCCSTNIVGFAGELGVRGGEWELLLNSSGVVAMHMALTHHNTIVMFDQTSADHSGYRLSPGQGRCLRGDPGSCFVHSVEYDIAANSIRPLVLQTDTWCSSGAFLSNGTLVQTGGNGTGGRRIRYFDPCTPDRSCDWQQSESLLADIRWYATNQILPENDRVFIVGGKRAYSYEFLPKSSARDGAFELPLLSRTNDPKEGNPNLYPFVHLSSDGNLFIFANRDSILFDYNKNKVVREFPRIPGDGARNYPSTGSSVMLPLDHTDGFHKVEIMVCGGAQAGAYEAAANRSEFLRGLKTCGRIVITDEEPEWEMETMPGPRLMSDMLILPSGDILLINGATHGCAGWRMATNPSYSPYLYQPKKEIGERFSSLIPSQIPRMYHSSAIVLPDGRVLVAGSNTNVRYTFTGVPFPTELRVEAFTPYYMSDYFDYKRPMNMSIRYDRQRDGIEYGDEFIVQFKLGRRRTTVVSFHIYAPAFVTHSQSMNQRLLSLSCSRMERDGETVQAVLRAPSSPIAAPSGYYLLTVVNGGIPSEALWVRFVHA